MRQYPFAKAVLTELLLVSVTILALKVQFEHHPLMGAACTALGLWRIHDGFYRRARGTNVLQQPEGGTTAEIMGVVVLIFTLLFVSQLWQGIARLVAAHTL